MELPATRILLGDAGEATPGDLRLAGDDGADVRYRDDGEMPFEVRAVDEIVCGATVAAMPPRSRATLLLECRRVLRPGGRLRVRLAERPAGEWSRLLGLLGFAGTAAGGGSRATLEVVKRERAPSREPLVSILIPAFNPRYFAAALRSAIAQTWRNIEIVVCDDSPGPEIESIVRSREGPFPIRDERNPVRLRTRANSIRCFELAQGEFVKFLHDDDLLAPACLETLLGAFRQCPDVTLATSTRALVDEAGRPVRDHPSTMPILGETRVVAGHSLANTMIGAGLNVVGEPSTTLFRRDDLADQAPRYFRFDEVEGRGILDMATWATLLLRGDAVYFRERLSSVRIHDHHDYAPDLGVRTVESIRGLQAAWLALGIFDRLPPDLLLTRAWPPQRNERWRIERVRSFVAPPMAPTARLAAWRSERAEPVMSADGGPGP
jgi:glycosyltransferase involved in cell wall biosynthesis